MSFHRHALWLALGSRAGHMILTSENLHASRQLNQELGIADWTFVDETGGDLRKGPPSLIHRAAPVSVSSTTRLFLEERWI